MKKSILKTLLFTFLALAIPTSAVADDDFTIPRYDIECAGVEGSEGSYLVQVWVYMKKPKADFSTFKMVAVHGVLFRGYGNETGCKAQRPLAGSQTVENEKADFFKPFFNEGQYEKYTKILDSSITNQKINKKLYRMGMVVSVAKDQLRKDLEKAGVLKGLGSIF
ncbi:MAG: hypothetical protein E7087_03310 [Bacteroidales bacterium]|nr:hypothetical protein [Bacteroidales bacterium]MBO5262849.1 hypothetical protein [Bacteroidaceae bacterium]